METLVEEAVTLDLEDGVYDVGDDWIGMITQDTTALTAASFPVKPPSSWFSDPEFNTLTPLSIDNLGRVSGHIAGWKSAHIGMAGGIKPPKSRSNYAYFRTGQLETDDGALVDVGQITLAGGHASLNASVAEAVAHYDNTQSAVMDVACGEDKHGIWVAGALRPDVDDTTIRAIRASSVSGDWRPINGKLEMVAVCAVNCPGFPIPRARVASGTPVAMVAAGTGAIVEKILDDRAAAKLDAGLVASLDALRNRLVRVETLLLDKTGAVRSDDDLAATVGDAKAEELTLRQRGDQPVVAAGDEAPAEAPAADAPADETQAPADAGADLHEGTEPGEPAAPVEEPEFNAAEPEIVAEPEAPVAEVKQLPKLTAEQIMERRAERAAAREARRAERAANEEKRAALRDRVKAPIREAQVASLRARVHAD